jgi:nucleotide-binding universal stress UspA family protein
MAEDGDGAGCDVPVPLMDQTMFRNLLLGLDGTPASESALELACRWAVSSGAAVSGLAVVDEAAIRAAEPDPTGGYSLKASRDEARIADAHRLVDSILAHFQAFCAGRGVQAQALRRVGSPEEEFLELAEDFDVTLLGREPRLRIGAPEQPDETFGALASGSHRPVVSVPERLPDSANVIVAYNGSPAAARALEALQHAGIFAECPTWVVSVDRDADLAARRADEAVKFLRHHGFHADARPVASSRAAGAIILKHAEELNAGLLVLGARGTGPARRLLRSSTEWKLRSDSSAVLFIHP